MDIGAVFNGFVPPPPATDFQDEITQNLRHMVSAIKAELDHAKEDVQMAPPLVRLSYEYVDTLMPYIQLCINIG